jgi:hypothetical protein
LPIRRSSCRLNGSKPATTSRQPSAGSKTQSRRRTTESTGEYVDDVAVFSKVKAVLFAVGSKVLRHRCRDRQGRRPDQQSVNTDQVKRARRSRRGRFRRAHERASGPTLAKENWLPRIECPARPAVQHADRTVSQQDDAVFRPRRRAQRRASGPIRHRDSPWQICTGISPSIPAAC